MAVNFYLAAGSHGDPGQASSLGFGGRSGCSISTANSSSFSNFTRKAVALLGRLVSTRIPASHFQSASSACWWRSIFTLPPVALAGRCAVQEFDWHRLQPRRWRVFLLVELQLTLKPKIDLADRVQPWVGPTQAGISTANSSSFSNFTRKADALLGRLVSTRIPSTADSPISCVGRQRWETAAGSFSARSSTSGPLIRLLRCMVGHGRAGAAGSSSAERRRITKGTIYLDTT